MQSLKLTENLKILIADDEAPARNRMRDLLDDIEKHIKYLKANLNTSLALHVHPIVKSHLTKGLLFNSFFSKWKTKYGSFVIVEDPGFEFLQYKFYDKNTGEEIKF